MGIEYIDLNKPESGFTFSTCVRAGDFLFLSHHGGYDFEAGKWPASIGEQTEICFANIERTLKTAGSSLADIVKTTVYLKSLDDFPKMREVYREKFSQDFPARMTAVSEFIDPECLILIEGIAYNPR
jgi:2-iminobutanoate/2-iminopropanoate deaminase